MANEHPRAAAVVAAARMLVGVPFRPQGRSVSGGLDCVGVVIAAAGAAGIPLHARADYALRGQGPETVARELAAAGCVRLAGAVPAPGDLLLTGPAPLQAHLAIWTADGCVEADVRLRRVVERPVEGRAWHSLWRLPIGED